MPPLFLLAACAGTPSDQPIDAGSGPNPTLPQPESKAIPTVNVAPAKGWSGDQKPSAAAGFAVSSYAADLDHPRWLYVLPNGDVLVAETNAPERPEDKKGIKGFFMGRAQKKAGAGVPSANRITLLRDADGDGKAEFRSVFLKDLNSPFGMALVGNDFYVANTDAVMRFEIPRRLPRSSTGPGKKVADLPAGPINHHWTKNLIASADGKHLYVTVGSNSNVAERGMENEERRAAILEIDPATGSSRVFASGLRNPNGLDWQPQSGALWTAVNERDELGNDLVPDYITSVKDGGFYGWPYSYYGRHRRRAPAAAAARPGREGHRPRLRARRAHGVARARVLSQRSAAATLSRRRVRRAARLVESQAHRGLPRDLHPVLGRAPDEQQAGGDPDGLRRRARARARPPGRRRCRRSRCVARGRRRRQSHLARDASAARSKLAVMSANQSANEAVHLVCGHCDRVVRVPPERFAEGPRCPKCHNPLFEDHPLELKSASFDRHITRSDLPVIVDFWAPWCGPCRVMAPHYEEAARRLKHQARFAKVNSDEEPALSKRFGIRGIPTLIAFKQGREVARQVGGMDLNGLLRWTSGI